MIGMQELVIVLIIVIILFGGTKIPEIMRGLGKGIKEFKKAKEDIESDTDKKSDKPNT
ncbi:MAG: preprotein translocase [Candidatus Raymondbacteria bacterium RifOxyA12_full_50_37]|nr:MAG: preprotein translocase [Candidatus Raymondbacteria bacterium RIFOXYA2_FULL_49_16]OGJ90583.1 MAG: preprotein translocase [Candidatus Raymondbacteria bacterium RifOxyA12_full_50_37]OGJ99406.1 MAG: preprotein translocase [Candidatus Raymondbacteria bacterium RIFOXYC2_FULL_50_21]OGJ99585.1 MAG: preprotein translocase [Candidatus Raymondbacteria bacterium RifOxyB12_full_50_8]OGK03450.1 MAG: preprotein translocase [Candidatus Raymondbacteria bacterium RifOxyC12_full_50_8]OGP40491.1 MAG: prep